MAVAMSRRRQQYASATDEQANKQTNKQTEGHRRRRVKPSLCGEGLTSKLLHTNKQSYKPRRPQSTPRRGCCRRASEPFNRHINGPSCSITVIGTLAVDGRAVAFGTAKRGLGGAAEAIIVPNQII